MANPVAIIGAGCAGLAAAYRLSQEGSKILLLEKQPRIGGLAETLTDQGVRFDLGPHVFFKKDPVVSKLWRTLLQDKFKTYRRRSSIYYRNQRIQSPLKVWDAFSKIGLSESFEIAFSFLKAKVGPRRSLKTSHDWVTGRFGEKFYEMFYRVYNRKIWGLEGDQIVGDWAGQRIKRSLPRMILDSLLQDPGFMIREFEYPDEGAAMMHEAFLKEIKKNPAACFQLDSEVSQVCHDGQIIQAIEVIHRDSNEKTRYECEALISSMPVDELIEKLHPAPPQAVLETSRGLKYRGLVCVFLTIDRKNAGRFQEHWVDVHSPDIQMLRATNFGNFGPGMSHDSKIGLTAEYGAWKGDSLWNLEDEPLIDLARREMEKMGLVRSGDVEGGFVRKIEKAYAVYSLDYADKVAGLRNYLKDFENLQTIGRHGMFRYNNMHHSVHIGLLAAENARGSHHDLWQVESSIKSSFL